MTVTPGAAKPGHGEFDVRLSLVAPRGLPRKTDQALQENTHARRRA